MSYFSSLSLSLHRCFDWKKREIFWRQIRNGENGKKWMNGEIKGSPTLNLNKNFKKLKQKKMLNN